MDRELVAERIGRNVFRHRRQAGLSQAELGQLIGTAQPNVSALEGGKMPSMPRFIQLCKALNARPDQLLKGIVKAD